MAGQSDNRLIRALAAYQSAYRKLSAADTVLAQQNEQNRTLQDLLRPGDVSRLTYFRSQLRYRQHRLGRSDAFRQAQEALGMLRGCSGRPLTGTPNLPASAVEKSLR